jgi:hypothetical protein
MPGGQKGRPYDLVAHSPSPVAWLWGGLCGRPAFAVARRP